MFDIVDDILDTVTDLISDGVRFIEHIIKIVYNNILDDMFGIDDEKFLGLKGDIGSTLGATTKDILHDHVHYTVMLIIQYIISLYLPPIVSSYMANLYLTGARDVLINRALGYIATDESTKVIMDRIDKSYYQKYIVQIYKDIAQDSHYGTYADSSIYSWLAGGRLYNSIEAGGELYHDTYKIDKYAKVFGYPDDGDVAVLYSKLFAYEQEAGGVYYKGV
jgi:hypothetical protein